MAVPGYVLALSLASGSVPALLTSMASILTSPKQDVSLSLEKGESEIYVIHDGRLQEGYPIFSHLPFLSVMEGASKKKDNPNKWRHTDLRDDAIPEVAKKEFLYSEFSPLYVIWKKGVGAGNFIGKMHYRSYLNLMEKDKIIKVNAGEDNFGNLNEEQLFGGDFPPDWDYTQRMGYRFENIKSIMNGEGSSGKNSGLDILTSTPLNFGGDSITSQFIMAHGGNGAELLLARIMVKAGELIYKYNRSTFGHEDKIDDKEKTAYCYSEKLGKYGFATVKSGADDFFEFSKTWDEHTGLLNYIIGKEFPGNGKYKNEGAKAPYMKDLFIMRDFVFSGYMTFIYYMLENIESECREEIEKYKKIDPQKGSRILAFLGERLTSYFIHYMLVHFNFNVGVIPRAHYGNGIKEFIEGIFPETENLVPLFKFRKITGGSAGEQNRFEMLYLVAGEDSTSACNEGYTFESCLGYLIKNEPGNNSSGKVFYKIKKDLYWDYGVADKSAVPKDGVILGFEVLEKDKSPVLLSLKQEAGVYNQVFCVDGSGKSPVENSISVASFGRSDIINGI